ncbi:MAG: MBL fold metallo-hydrolase, partial [Hyphomicrobiales bacterium]|nr:MBL fold metallo-hydrolase [Hyphomicrobiales bacterium]
TNKAAVIDPGGDVEKIEQVLKEAGVALEKILITHGHIDHVGGAAELAQRTGVPIEGPHPGDKLMLDQLPAIAAQYGFPKADAVKPGRWLDQGDVVTVGETIFDVRHVPGHSPGHVIFIWRKQPGDAGPPGFVIMGDVLFRGSIGRTDLPGGDHALFLRMIKERVMTLPDETIFTCGHGPMSSIGDERRDNPFLETPWAG